MIGNLLLNAAKFTPRGGRTTVALARDGENAWRATEAGFDRHLAKPPNLQKLDEALAAARERLASR